MTPEQELILTIGAGLACLTYALWRVVAWAFDAMIDDAFNLRDDDETK